MFLFIFLKCDQKSSEEFQYYSQSKNAKNRKPYAWSVLGIMNQDSPIELIDKEGSRREILEAF